MDDDANADKNFNTTAQACATKVGVDFDAAAKCASSGFKTLMNAAIMENIKAKVAETPWVVVADTEYFGGANVTYANLLKAICKADPSIAAC